MLRGDEIVVWRAFRLVCGCSSLPANPARQPRPFRHARLEAWRFYLEYLKLPIPMQIEVRKALAEDIPAEDIRKIGGF